MDDDREYYTVFWDEAKGPTYETLDAAIAEIAEILKYEAESDARLGDETGNCKIKIETMTPEAFAALPAFQGY